MIPPTPLATTLDLHFRGRELVERIAQRFGAALHVRLDEHGDAGGLLAFHLRERVFGTRAARARELHVAELALAMQSHFTRLALALDREHFVAGIRRRRQAEHDDRRRRTRFLHRLAVLVEHGAHAAELGARDDRIADLQRALLHEHGRDGAAALLDAGLDDEAAREARLRRLELEDFGLQQDGFEQLVDALRPCGRTRSRTDSGRPTLRG